MFPRLALIPIGLLFIWGYMCHQRYVCHIKQACPENDAPAAVVDSTAASTEDAPDFRPLVFNWSDATAVTRDGFPSYRDSILASLPEGNILEIVGHYFEKETSPEDFSNMGMARASAFKAFLGNSLADDRILVSSQARSEPNGVRDNPFEAISFNFIVPTKEEKVEIVEVDDQIIIQFPFNAATKKIDPAIDARMDKLVIRLNQTEETISVTGHTDDIGEDDSNIALGRNRAKYIVDILIKKGIDKNRISMSSKGEGEPVADNGSEEGRRRNRRAVLKLNKAN